MALLSPRETPLGAFMPPYPLDIRGNPDGALKDLTFAAKDLFDVEGYVTGCGNPVWAEQQAPASTTAPFIQSCLDAGATLHGKTITDEMAFSINGENVHYGTPVNVHAPGCIPGGSSSGSVAATAGGIVDFALGSDTGGSVRVPASYCGVFGIRTSHGLIPLPGSALLAPSFDTIGWFARDPAVFEAVGSVLLPASVPSTPLRKLLIVDDGFGLLDPAFAADIAPVVDQVASSFDVVEHVTLTEDSLASWLLAFRYLQGRDIYEVHGRWLDRNTPGFGPGIRDRFDWVQSIDHNNIMEAQATRQKMIRQLNGLLDPETVLLIPTAASSAPQTGQGLAPLDDVRALMMRLCCISGLSALPQVSLPLASHEDKPFGLSLIGSRMADRSLLSWAADFCHQQRLVWKAGKLISQSEAS